MLPILHSNRIFDNQLASFDNLFNDLFRGHSGQTALPLDVRETETEYQYLVDVPGMAQEDLNIQVHNGILTIQGQRQTEQTTQKDGYYSRERWSGSFSRSVRLPSTADTSKVQANLRQGVLTICVAKAETAKPLKIDVKSDV